MAGSGPKSLPRRAGGVVTITPIDYASPPMNAKPSVDGLLLVDKKSGLTSHDVVELFRRRSKIKKVGHTGTLDPLATGLLVLCIGKATRLQAYLMGMEKTYEGVIQFGWATDSFDAAGEPAGEVRETNIE